MPHINRIRVNNVKYNFGTQYYDDFMMRFSGKNTIYDLANGGGKSVLMLLLMQNLIPNCTLDDKQPIEKLFRTNEGSTTIHSMIEWILSDAHIKDNFKYMLTGFCARRAKETGEENTKNTAEIEYFNYCIFYRKYNDNDIKNLPLKKDNERITYTGLKNYLKDIQKSDYNLEVHIFERKGDYQNFISNYGLYESHWEIIRGINKTEGHVRTYFESNYKTTRKVVEDLLIEGIIQKSFKNKYNSKDEEDIMAKTLLDIKDKLLELSKKKEDIQNYDRQIEILNTFGERIQNIRQLYVGMNNLEMELAKAYNTIRRDINEKKDQRIRTADHRMDILHEKNELSRKVETAKVIKKSNELDGYKKQLETVAKEITELKKNVDILNSELSEKECANDYLDYISYKEEYDKLKHVLENQWKDKDALISEVKRLVVLKKKYNEERTIQIDNHLETEYGISIKENTSYESSIAEDRELDNKAAVVKYTIDSDRKLKDEVLIKLEAARKDAGILIPATAQQELVKVEQDKGKYNTKLQELCEELESIQKEQEHFIFEKQKLIENNKGIESELNWYKSIEKEYNEKKDKVDSICKVYGCTDTKSLQSRIQKAIKEKVCSINSLEKNISNKNKKLISGKAGKPFGESDSVTDIIEYIERYHGEKAVSGLDYIKNLSEDNRKDILWRVPILPYSIVVESGFNQIISDQKLLELRNDEQPIALIKESSIKRDEIISNVDNIFYLINKEAFFITPEQLNNQIKVLESDINSDEEQLDRQRETLKVMEDDYDFISGYNSNLSKYTEYIDNAKNLKFRFKESSSALDELEQSEDQWQNSIKSITDQIEDNKEKLEQCNNRCDVLRIVKQCYDQLSELDDRISSAEIQSDKLTVDSRNIKKRITALQEQISSRKVKIEKYKNEKAEIINTWDKKYSVYYSEDTEIADTTSYEEIDAKLDAVIDVINNENADFEDKNKLLANYSKSMSRISQRIGYKGYNIDEFKQRYDEKQLTETSPDEFEVLKSRIHDEKTRTEDAISEEKKILSERDKLEGNITNSIHVISEKYGYYEEECINNLDADVFITENSELLSYYEKEISNTDIELKRLDSEINNYMFIEHDIENRMEIEGITARKTDEFFDSGINPEERCKEILRKHEKFRNDVLRRKDEFVHEKQLLIETMNSIDGEALASEIHLNVNMPANFEQAEQLSKMLEETTECISLEKERVGKGIEDMEKIKDNFENQCLQNCLNIKTELERLPKLSKIVMDGETISIISLKIPYKKEDIYKSEMSEYIDDIARNTDSLKTSEERIKYIRNQLNWKKLFSVVVTDMNAIKLNLYKRERIKEQSRYLPYEEAVGSTGQSQGIYIQFLISIINYISSINSKNADASKLRKAIFLDNPFGAAKDVYIWEPIFKLLKTNNVQLIVPARGATPAITGRFDVNYILGQRMTGKRQQTVVVDYFSNVKNEEIEYTNVSYQQT